VKDVAAVGKHPAKHNEAVTVDLRNYNGAELGNFSFDNESEKSVSNAKPLFLGQSKIIHPFS